MKRTAILFGVCVVFLASRGMARAAQFAGGTGEPNDPYQIATAEQLISIGSDPNLLDKHFILTSDIDLDPNLPGNRIFDRAVIAPDMNDTVVGFQGSAFNGLLNGQNHVIAGLVIDANVPHAGLFGMIGTDGRICNLRLVGGSVWGQALVYGRGSIDGATGSLAGVNQGLITACRATCSVSGGFAAGGLVGHNDRGLISNCSSTGPVSGTGWYVGGLVGWNSKGVVTNCFSTGAVTGSDAVGGLVAYNYHGMISACFSTAAVSGRSAVGGLVGNNYDGEILVCYSAGKVAATAGSVGGMVGTMWRGIISACLWDIETSGQTKGWSGEGRTTAQMMDMQTFLDVGWDFLGERANGVGEHWQMPPGGGYPVLSAFQGDVRASSRGQEPPTIRTCWRRPQIWALLGRTRRPATA